MTVNYRQLYAIKAKNKGFIKNAFPWLNLTEQSGIYVFTRNDLENGKKYAYVGQAKHILDRLESHWRTYELHIDRSLKKRKFYNNDNLGGWYLGVIYCEEKYLDTYEKNYIDKYQSLGYELYNITCGGQGVGKYDINERKARKGYAVGLKNGYIKAQKEVAKYFAKNLVVSVNGQTNKLKEKSLQKFMEFIGEKK